MLPSTPSPLCSPSFATHFHIIIIRCLSSETKSLLWIYAVRWKTKRGKKIKRETIKNCLAIYATLNCDQCYHRNVHITRSIGSLANTRSNPARHMFYGWNEFETRNTSIVAWQLTVFCADVRYDCAALIVAITLTCGLRSRSSWFAFWQEIFGSFIWDFTIVVRFSLPFVWFASGFAASSWRLKFKLFPLFLSLKKGSTTTNTPIY